MLKLRKNETVEIQGLFVKLQSNGGSTDILDICALKNLYQGWQILKSEEISSQITS